MRLYIITKRNLISIGFCLLIGVLAGAIAVTSTVRAVQSAAAQREIPIYYVDTDKKQVALSFDAAWGNEQTEHLLEILDKYKVKSTFFLVGDWVKNYPDSVKDIAKHGHDVGNHSNTHPHMTQMSSSDMVGQIQSCNEKIKELTGKTPTLFRAPYGDYNNDVVKSVNGCNMYCVQWDVDSLDWKDPTPEQIKQGGLDAYYVDHTLGIYPSSAAGVPFTAAYFQSKGDILTDLHENMAAEQKARTTYDNILRFADDPDVRDPIKFLRQREIVHFQRFGEALRISQDNLNSRNFYAFNPEFDVR